MPRYFFHSADGKREPDQQGTELPDDAAAQFEAVRFAGETLKWRPLELWKQGQWRVEVTDDQGALLFTIITIAGDAPPHTPREAPQSANDAC